LLACDAYDAKFPISLKPDGAIDEKLLGEWIILVQEEEAAYPGVVVNLIEMGGNEYLAKITMYKDNSLNIDEVNIFQVHKSDLGVNEYYNFKDLEDDEEKYFFYTVEKSSVDSIQVNYIADSFKIEFDNSKEFKKYLEENLFYLEQNHLSEGFPMYRRSALNWNLLNPKYTIDDIEDVRYYKGLTAKDIELDNWIELTSEKSIDISDNSFPIIMKKATYKETHHFWDSPYYCQVEFKSGHSRRFKIDGNHKTIFDLDMNLLYKISD
jgi:hypothetical protein